MSGPKSALENDISGSGPAVALQDAGFLEVGFIMRLTICQCVGVLLLIV